MRDERSAAIPVRSRLDGSLWQTEETEMEKQSSAAFSPQFDFMFQRLDSRVNNSRGHAALSFISLGSPRCLDFLVSPL